MDRTFWLTRTELDAVTTVAWLAIAINTPFENWMRRTANLLGEMERAVQIRALVSARNSSDLFDLRCFVREAIVAYLRDQQPGALPRTRSNVDAADLAPSN